MELVLISLSLISWFLHRQRLFSLLSLFWQRKARRKLDIDCCALLVYENRIEVACAEETLTAI